jgi:hypothetical protein
MKVSCLFNLSTANSPRSIPICHRRHELNHYDEKVGIEAFFIPRTAKTVFEVIAVESEHSSWFAIEV